MVGAHEIGFDIFYTKENELLNDMPYYVDNARLSAIWFDGIDWNIGAFTDLKDGYMGDLFTLEFVECPSDTNTWVEWIDSDWKTNLNATLSCVKDTNVNAKLSCK